MICIFPVYIALCGELVLMCRFAAISPQTPMPLKRKMAPPSTATPLPKSKLADLSSPAVSSPLAIKTASSPRYGIVWTLD